MATLLSLIPDVDVLLSLAPEELAEIVLRFAAELGQCSLAHLLSLKSQIDGSPGANDGYPQNRRKESELAVAEAWQWLIIQGLLIPEPRSNGTNGYLLLSRRAQKLLSAGLRWRAIPRRSLTGGSSNVQSANLESQPRHCCRE